MDRCDEQSSSPRDETPHDETVKGVEGLQMKSGGA